MNVRTYLMAGITCITVLGFALVAFTKGVASRLIGYCGFCFCRLSPCIPLLYKFYAPNLSILGRSNTRTLPTLTPDLTGSSNAAFVLGLSLISGNVGGTRLSILLLSTRSR